MIFLRTETEVPTFFLTKIKYKLKLIYIPMYFFLTSTIDHCAGASSSKLLALDYQDDSCIHRKQHKVTENFSEQQVKQDCHLSS